MAYSDADISASRRFTLGMGCERGAPVADVMTLAIRALAEAGVSMSSVAAVASIDSKIDEAAIVAVASHLGVPFQGFSAARLEAETPRLKTPSKRVFALIGCHGVAEAAALAAAGPSSFLFLSKTKSAFATVAIAEIL